MSDENYTDIMWAEMKPDCYAGDSCDELAPRWWAFAAGDRDSEFVEGVIILNPHTFPPGTKIEVSVPNCPDCGEQCMSINCPAEDCDCGFNWNDWALNKYS